MTGPTLRQRLRDLDTADADLVEDLTLWLRQQWDGGRTLAAVPLVARHPVHGRAGRPVILVDLFGAADAVVTQVRTDGFAALDRALGELADGAYPPHDLALPLLLTAFGADRVSATLRAGVLARRDRLRRPVDPIDPRTPLTDDTAVVGTLTDLVRVLTRGCCRMSAVHTGRR